MGEPIYYVDKVEEVFNKNNVKYTRISKQWGPKKDQCYDVCIPLADHMIPNKGEVFLDIGCGKLKMPGMIGIDKRDLDGVDVVCDVDNGTLPYEDNSVDLIHSSMLLEHITNLYHVMEEFWRVLKVDGKLIIIVPHWNSDIQWGDPDHKRAFDPGTFLYFDRESEQYEITDYEGFKGDFKLFYSSVFQPKHILSVMKKRKL